MGYGVGTPKHLRPRILCIIITEENAINPFEIIHFRYFGREPVAGDDGSTEPNDTRRGLPGIIYIVYIYKN